MFLLFLKQLFCRHHNRRCVHDLEAQHPENFPLQRKNLVVATCMRCFKGFYDNRPIICYFTKKAH